jgi:hypothetical protein
MKRIISYILIGIGAISAVIIPILFIPVWLQQIINFPEDRPCTIVSCAEQIIANCQPSHIWLDYGGGALGDSLRVNVTGWDEDGKCKLGMQLIPGELALNPLPYYLCSIPKDELRNWNGWRDSAYEGVNEIEEQCEIREA